MSRTIIYIALCAIVLGKKVINPGEQLPDGIATGKIQALLDNKSIEAKEIDAEPVKTKNTVASKPALVPDASATEVTGDGSGKSLPDVSNTEKTAEGMGGENTAIIKRAVSKDDRVIELNALSAAALKKVAGELNVSGAAQMKKEALVEAITAVEFAVSDKE
ncbi:hypothetical protein CBP51_16810 [Cellvibrio mixtus]|uniref:Rho termination factor-like N-terminal domain-containing protein n=1 Tax=Cellvibrio mixtus TaxID=39650 RepID=A0A266Q4R9_9GAMM|nr:Rho termination factor N-terminal domain-containing protein [Cellvibrio mixtus]OZY84822.1 hypothetical protein CBP51_16810 [Cellvibrio mixtus]